MNIRLSKGGAVMNTWWERMGYPPFAADSEGFPRPGQVTKYFRERLQKSSGWSWSQRDLGLVLNLSEITVRKMENTDMGLDSISRRRTLVKLLGIPPLLMGLAEPPSEASASSPADSSST